MAVCAGLRLRQKTEKEGPTFVVLRQTERNQPFIVLFLTQQRVCKEKRSSRLKDKVCLAENRNVIDSAMTK